MTTPETASQELTGLAAIEADLKKRQAILDLQEKAKQEERRVKEGKHGFLYRELPPEEDPFQEDEAKRHKRLMNCSGAWDR